MRPAGASATSTEYSALASFFDAFAREADTWRRRNATYHQLLERTIRFYVPRGQRVLEIGCGSGDLLAAVEPSTGVGVDVSSGMVELARSRHPDLTFVCCAGEELDLGETFDYIILSDLAPYVHDLQALFERVRAHSHTRTRVLVNSYSQLWRPLIHAAEALSLKPRKPIRNWVAMEDVVGLLRLSGFELVSRDRRILLPKRVPPLTTFLNGFVGSVWPFVHLCLSWWIVARPRGEPLGELSVSVVCPCRNEAGNVGPLIERLPDMGAATELIFVEGNSTDDTRAEIERQIATHAERDISLHVQTGEGKGDAVRLGFEKAKNDVLMILDGDLSVSPEDLPKFYRALADGHAELVNGSRLVYGLEPGAMRFLNLLGNKLFSVLLSSVLRQHVKDTLCGTKVLHRRDYDKIVAGRPYFGNFDPFGDFDLLLGAGRLGLSIVDLPVRYQARRYGRTNISRFRHGLLLARMTALAFKKFRIDPYRGRVH